MAKRRNIFFDVGNTLLFPNRARMLAPIPQEKHPTLDAWQALERRTKKEFDQGLITGKIDHGFCVSMYLASPDGLRLEFTVDAPDAEKIAAMRRKDAHSELARWMAGDRRTNNDDRPH